MCSKYGEKRVNGGFALGERGQVGMNVGGGRGKDGDLEQMTSVDKADKVEYVLPM